ncbi:MAG: S8/S53 family peptidase [Acidimicrobiales bacterium]
MRVNLVAVVAVGLTVLLLPRAAALGGSVTASAVSQLPVPSQPVVPQPPGAPAVPGTGSSSASQVSANGPSGMNLDAALALVKGAPHPLIAYVEGGINWHVPEARQLVNNIYVNWRELPIPCVGTTVATATVTVNGQAQPCQAAYSTNPANYEIDHDGVINANEWADDPRVTDVNHNGYIDPEDLIAAFSCYNRFNETIGTPSWPGGVLSCANGTQGISNSGSGYPHDVSGWNFYRNDNDPATADSAYTHADDQMSAILSVCPRCMIMPVKAGAEALDMTQTLAKAWLYAGHAGAQVIVSVTADLGYSSYMGQAINHLWHKGVVMVEASNDFDSTDHQGGMFWPHVIPGNGVVPDAAGTAWVRSNFTSWGVHNMFSVAGASTTSQSTAEMGGLFGLLLAYGDKAYAEGRIAHPLTGPQAVQVMRSTATPVTNTSLPWPGAPGSWSLQYGYGIPNLYRAMQAVAAAAVPLVPSISSPAWYSVKDPTVTSSVPVAGSITAPAGTSYHWALQAALGGQPAPGSWTTVGTGRAVGPFTGTLGTFDLSSMPKTFWSAPFHLSSTKTLQSVNQYTVTLRVVVTDSAGPVGVARRAINVVHDSSWVKGFPLRLPSSGESQPGLVDLQGSGHLDIVFGTSSGEISAIDPTTAKELPGWPVFTAPVPVRHHAYAGVDPGHQPVIADVAVSDLFHTGHLDVVATTLEGDVYAFDATGHLLAGWPKTVNAGLSGLPVPRPSLPNTHLPARGTLAPPVVAPLSGADRLDVVQVGWDGKIHAWTPAGTPLAGFPVTVPPPPGQPPSGYFALDNYKLITAPAVAYLNGRAKGPDLVVRSEYTWVNAQDGGVVDYGFAYAYSASGRLLPGWPVKMPGVLELTNDAMEFLLEGSDQPAAVPVPGTGTDLVAVGPVLTPPYLVDGGGTIVSTYGSVAPGASPSALDRLLHAAAAGTASGGAAGGASTALRQVDAPLPLGTSGAFGRLGGVLSYAQSEVGAVSAINALLVNSNGGLGIHQYEVAFPATGGPPLPGFPAVRQGLDFFGSPIITNVTANGADAVVEGGDSSALGAYTALGRMASGFPKWTTGWSFAAPSAGDLFSSGHTDLATVTREGYLFAWKTAGLAGHNNQWWRSGHDEYNSDRYGARTRPPGVPRLPAWRPGSSLLTFIAPGGTWYSGEVASYDVTFDLAVGSLYERVAPSGPAGATQKIIVPPGAKSIRIQAVNAAGLLGTPITLRS